MSPADVSLAELSDQHKGLPCEVESAVKNLEAERIDIVQLLYYLNDKGISRQQIPDLLKQAYQRLKKSRNLLTDLKTRTASNTRLSERINRVESVIQPNDSFSLNAVLQGLETIYSDQIDQNCFSEFTAIIRETQGLVAAIKQDYRLAANHYEEAARTPGLETEKQWQYLKDKALMLIDLGREFGENEALEQAVSILENEVLNLAPRKQRSESWSTTNHLLGDALSIMGQRQSGTRNLENAIAAYQQSLCECDQQQQPLQWAQTQNNLGNVLGILGHRQNDMEMLENAIQAFEQSLKERTRETCPQDWASTQNNLAAVLQSLGQRNKDAKMLKQSVNAYKAVLQEWTRERTPTHWATTMNNLGTTLRLLGEYRKGPRTLEQSIAAFNNALAIQTREQFPKEWAMIQNNLGAALQMFAEREENPDFLEQAINAYENALQEWTQDQTPMTWAMTMANLGVARRTLATHTENIESASKAVEELETVSEAFRNASHAQYSELIIDQLAQARKLMDTLYKAKGKYAGFVQQ